MDSKIEEVKIDVQAIFAQKNQANCKSLVERDQRCAHHWAILHADELCQRGQGGAEEVPVDGVRAGHTGGCLPVGRTQARIGGAFGKSNSTDSRR